MRCQNLMLIGVEAQTHHLQAWRLSKTQTERRTALSAGELWEEEVVKLNILEVAGRSAADRRMS